MRGTRTSGFPASPRTASRGTRRRDRDVEGTPREEEQNRKKKIDGGGLTSADSLKPCSRFPGGFEASEGRLLPAGWPPFACASGLYSSVAESPGSFTRRRRTTTGPFLRRAIGKAARTARRRGPVPTAGPRRGPARGAGPRTPDRPRAFPARPPRGRPRGPSGSPGIGRVSFGDRQHEPVLPRVSGKAPRSLARTGMPLARASIGTRPSDSRQSEGTSTARLTR